LKTIDDRISPINEKTEVIYDMEIAISYGVNFLNKAKKRLDILIDKNGPSFIIKNDIYKGKYINAKDRGVKIRFITEITKDNIYFCKELRKIVDELRHLDDLKGSISVSEIEFIGTTTWTEKQLANPVIYSNSKEVVDQQQYIFDILWKKSIDYRKVIMELEQGIMPEIIETSSNPTDIQDKVFSLLESANNEILILFATSNAFHRQDHAGSLKKLKEIVIEKPWMSIKILSPKDIAIEKKIKDLNTNNFNVRYVEPISKVSILIVDRNHSLIAELKEDKNQILSEDTLGFVTYSNSKPTVLTYVSIFNVLWKQIDMYKQLQKHDEIQKQFINTAAHELRTPIQPILGMVDVLKSNLKDERYIEWLDVISRNAKRLKKLAEDILDLTIIESNSLIAIKEHFKINDALQEVINNYKKNKEGKLVTFDFKTDNEYIVYADRNNISRVISNLINNSINFVPHFSTIYINVKLQEISLDKEIKKKLIIISIKDRGVGIPDELLPKLFTKFTTTSLQGLGLGLYISKYIIESHGGRMWAENNKDGIGATFYFSLPLYRE
jgi:signal transduction histidine kinase